MGLQYPEPEEEPPVPSGRGGGSRMLRGLMLCMEIFYVIFNVFSYSYSLRFQ